MNRLPNWSCPHCNGTILPDRLARDLFTEKLLKELPNNVSEIEFKEDHEHYKITKVDDPDSDNENEDVDEDKESKSDSVKKEGYVIPLGNSDVIDLVSDDDEEEQENQAKRARKS